MFTFRNRHFAALRKHALDEGLIRRFNGTQQIASRDRETGEILVRDIASNTTRIKFDDQGFIGTVISPLGRQWQVRNDVEGRVVRLTNPGGRQLGIEYGAQGRIARLTEDSRDALTFDYSSDGNLIKITYADGSATELHYQGDGQPSSVTNRLGTREEYHWNEHGLLDWIKDSNGNRTTFRYGMWNRPESMERPDLSTESYEYSSAGFVRLIGTGLETVAVIDHNQEGQPTHIHYGDSNWSSFTYNADGKITEALNSESVSHYQYDHAGRVAEEDQDGYVIKYSYDHSGTLVGFTYPSGEMVEYDYDPDLRLTSIKDWNQGEHHFIHTHDDRKVTHHLPNGLVSTTQQSNSGLPISIAVSRRDAVTGPRDPDLQRTVPNAENLFSFVYQYDNEERVRLFTDSEFGTCEFVYDSESQLLTVKAGQSGRDESFTYDSAGNCIRSNAREAAFNALNQLTRDSDRSYEYDVRGNMVKASAPASAWDYVYNCQNLLVKAEGPQEEVVTFGYDAFGRRIWKRSQGVEVRFVWAGEQLIREIVTDDCGERARDYLYHPGTFVPLATRIEGNTSYYHTDHLGTPRRITDGEGNIVWSAAYSAFGEVRLGAQRISNPLRFPGQYFDAETGLHYNRFRYYSPLLGRYLSRDPASFLAGLNFYIYADNNPIRRADPLGLWTWKAVGGGALAGLAVGALVLALAPSAVPVAVVAAAMIANAVLFGLNEAIHGDAFCISCFWKAAGEVFTQELGAVLLAAGLLAALFWGGPPALGGLALGGTGGVVALGFSVEQMIALGLAGAGALVMHGAGVAMMTGGQGGEARSKARDACDKEVTDKEKPRKETKAAEKPTRVTNPKHHPKSNSPEPKNVDELFDRAIVDETGTRWAKDENGIIHRFTKPSNGQTHWNGSTAGSDPIQERNIPAEIRSKLK